MVMLAASTRLAVSGNTRLRRRVGLEAVLFMAQYTAEEARKIIMGLASGKRPGYRPMPDAEFLRRYDPQTHHEQTMARLLGELTYAIKDLTALSPGQPIIRRDQPISYPNGPPPPTGPIAL